MASIPLMVAEDDVEGGGKGIEDDFAYRNNVAGANVKIRMGFLRKVYSLLFIQLLTTAIVGCIIMLWPEGRLYVRNNDWMVSLSFILSIVTLIALHIKRRHSPINFILLAAFTVVQAYSVGVVVTFFDTFVVIQALVLTVIVLLGLTLYTFQTKRDFSNLGTPLFIGLTVLIFGGFLQLLLGTSQMELLISIAGAILFSLFIIYDTQDLMKRLSPEEYIVATISLYLDVINLFIYILRALEAARRN